MKQILYLIFLISFGYEGAYSQADWPMPSHDREQTSWAGNELQLAPPFNMRVIQCPSPVAEAYDKYSPYIISASGMLYLAIDNTPNWLLPLDPVTGTSPWFGIVTGSCCSVGTSPVAAGDVIVQGGHNFSAMLTGFDKISGDKLWENPVGSLYGRNVIADGEYIYYRLENMTCLDAATGDEVWSIALPGYPNVGTPAIDDLNTYFTYEDTLFAVDKMTGSHKWLHAGAGHEGLCVDENHVYFNRKDAVYAVDKYTGTVEWQHTIPDENELAFMNGNSIAIDDTHLLYAVWANRDTLATLTMLDKTTGTLQWTHVFPGEGTFAPTIANGVVYIVNWETRSLWGLDIATGNVVFEEPSRKYWAQPIVADGTLYVNSPNSDSTGYAVVAFTSKANALHNVGEVSSPDISVYPNPFSHNASVQYTLQASAQVTINVYTLVGEYIGELFSGQQVPGTHHCAFNAGTLPLRLSRGMYTLHVTINNTPSFVMMSVLN